MYDLAIIGAGPGGYVAAIRARQLGMDVVLIEKNEVGGVCLNWGCIPSKSLIHNATIYDHLEKLRKWGMKVDSEGFDYAKVHSESRKAANTLTGGVQSLLRKNKVKLIKGTAHFVDANTLKIEGQKDPIKAKNIIIATGSRPREILGFSVDEKTVLSSTGVLSMTKLPKKVTILGGGAIGIEFAFIFCSFGVEVSIVEMIDRILPLEDKEIVEQLQKVLEKKGIVFYTGAKAQTMRHEKGGVSVSVILKDGSNINIGSDVLIVSVGRSANSEGLNLSSVGIKTEKGRIVTSDYYQTSVPSVYAIGDVIDTPQLAHLASKEGEIVVEHIAGQTTISRVEDNSVPSAIYAEPQLASFGYTEEELITKKINYKKMLYPYRGIGKAVALDCVDGLIKVLVNKETSEILGCHVMGVDATEILHTVLLAKETELLPEDLAQMIFAHPTLSEGLMESMKGIGGRGIHI